MKLLLTLAIIGALAFCGATVPLGKKTFFGHVKSIWSSQEMSELKDGVKDKAGPAVETGKEFVEGGMKAVKKKEVDAAGSGSDHERR